MASIGASWKTGYRKRNSFNVGIGLKVGCVTEERRTNRGSGSVLKTHSAHFTACLGSALFDITIGTLGSSQA